MHPTQKQFALSATSLLSIVGACSFLVGPASLASGALGATVAAAFLAAGLAGAVFSVALLFTD